MNVDVTLVVDGWYGDSSRMYAVGRPKKAAERLVRIAHEAMMRGIGAVRPGARLGDVGHAIQSYAASERCSVVRDFCGHGIGQVFHDSPNILNFGKPNTGPELREGMIFTVEPMINLGRPEVKMLADEWTAVTRDRSFSAQFEHSIGVTAAGSRSLPSRLRNCMHRASTLQLSMPEQSRKRRQLATTWRACSYSVSGWSIPAKRSAVVTIIRALVALCAVASPSVVSAQTESFAQEGERMSLQEELTATGPTGPLKGTLILPSHHGPLPTKVPVFLIVPGSGPTDRDGNSPLGIAAAPYRLLAEALAERGYPSVRIDKRGMFGSADAVSDRNDVTIASYGEDLLAWTNAIRERLPAKDGTRCVIAIGHSEGGLVALAAMARMPDACGLILIASIGRPLDEVIREQLRANPANAPFVEEAETALAALRRGKRVDVDAMNAALWPLFAPEVQGFLIDAMSYDPTELAAQVRVPVLVVQGTRDLQVSVADARMLADAAPDSTLALVPDVNHVLKPVASDDPSANLATYANADLPISSEVVDAITKFVAGVTKK